MATFSFWAPGKQKNAYGLSGTTADTNIACADADGTDIEPGDTITECVETDTNTDRRGAVSITSSGNIQVSVDTSGNTLDVKWISAAAAP